MISIYYVINYDVSHVSRQITELKNRDFLNTQLCNPSNPKDLIASVEHNSFFVNRFIHDSVAKTSVSFVIPIPLL